MKRLIRLIAALAFIGVAVAMVPQTTAERPSPDGAAKDPRTMGPYRVLTSDAVAELGMPALKAIEWEDGSDLGDILAARKAAGLNQLASEGWELILLEPAYVKSLSGVGNPRIHYPPMYVFKKSEP